MKTAIGLIAVVLLAAEAALADPRPGPEITAGARAPITDIGIAVGLGGGVTNYAHSDMMNATNVGAAYEARVTVGTRLFVAGEIAYVGSRRALTESVTGVRDGHIFSHGIEGDARLQYPLYTGGWMIEPFAFGGLGWTHYGVDAPVNNSSVLANSDDVFTVPFGGGLAAGWKQLYLEGRFTYRQAFNEDLLKNASGNSVPLSNWTAGALVGYEF